MSSWVQMALTVVCAVIASSGFWTYIQKRSEKKDVKTRMLVGLCVGHYGYAARGSRRGAAL